MGDGSRTRFWHGIWRGDRPLKEYFPELFCLLTNKDAMVVDLRSVSINTFIGTLTSLGLCMIGRWALPPLSSMFCIPLWWVGKSMIDYVGRPQKQDPLGSNLFTRFFFLTFSPHFLGRHLED